LSKSGVEWRTGRVHWHDLLVGESGSIDISGHRRVPVQPVANVMAKIHTLSGIGYVSELIFLWKNRVGRVRLRGKACRRVGWLKGSDRWAGGLRHGA